MKNLIIIFSLFATICLSSCKQDWVCQCIDADKNLTNTPINGGTFLHAEHTCHHMPGTCQLLTESR